MFYFNIMFTIDLMAVFLIRCQYSYLSGTIAKTVTSLLLRCRHSRISSTIGDVAVAVSIMIGVLQSRVTDSDMLAHDLRQSLDRLTIASEQDNKVQSFSLVLTAHLHSCPFSKIIVIVYLQKKSISGKIDMENTT